MKTMKKTTKKTTPKSKSTLRGIKGGKDNQTKKDIVDYVSDQTGITKKDVKKVMDSTFNVIKDVTKSGGYITLTKFGTFKQKTTAKKTIKSIATGKKIQVGGNKKMDFKPSAK